jgi:zona occludens toxin
MITFITGAPGSGKTLYTISKLLAPIVGTSVTGDKDVLDETTGLPIEYKRTIFTNIKGLLVDHELIADDYLNTWHEWAKPGSIICYDEVQKPWPPRPNGAKVPDYIQHLETHRHMGVDFIVMTQHPMLVDRNLVNLVGRHLHIRRVGNMPLAVVYEWDHTSKSLLYKNSITKSPWRYDKKVYKLYKSADLHTKQPRRIPGLIWFLLIGLAAFAYLGPSAYFRLQERAFGKGKPATPEQAIEEQNKQMGIKPSAGAKNAGKEVFTTADEYLAPSYPRVAGQPWTAPRYDDLTKPVRVPVIRGCVDLGEAAPPGQARAWCMLDGGVLVYPPLEFIKTFLRDRHFYDFEASGRAGDLAASQPRNGDRSVGQDRPPLTN